MTTPHIQPRNNEFVSIHKDKLKNLIFMHEVRCKEAADMVEEIAHLRLTQRTPGTVEHCCYCDMRLPMQAGVECAYNPVHGKCPLRAGQEG